jgi:hypothetical protein
MNNHFPDIFVPHLTSIMIEYVRHVPSKLSDKIDEVKQ